MAAHSASNDAPAILEISPEFSKPSAVLLALTTAAAHGDQEAAEFLRMFAPWVAAKRLS